VASALVNTMQQVGGSIGVSALSTISLSATASYLISHHTGRLAPAIAATDGYTTAFTVSAALFGLGFILAIILLPSRHRLAELRNAAAPAAAAPAAAAPGPASAPAASPAAPAPQPAFGAIPVALCSCSPVMTAVSGPTPPLARGQTGR
jgi:hypothetical protein